MANIARNRGQLRDLHRKIDPYSAYRAACDKELEITRLKQTIKDMKQFRILKKIL